MTRRSLFHHVGCRAVCHFQRRGCHTGGPPLRGAVKGFRRLQGHADPPRLVAALRARYQRLGLGVSVEHVA